MIYYEIQNLYQENADKLTLLTILSNEIILEYYGILHDKDKYGKGHEFEGLTKKPHYHLMVGVQSKNDKDKLVKIFTPLKCGQIKNVKVPKSFIRYLTHKDDKDKYQYNDDEVFTNYKEMYFEFVNVINKASNTDLLLNEFIKYLNDKCYEGLFLNSNDKYIDLTTDILQWFISHNKVSYYVQHKRNIDQIAFDMIAMFTMEVQNED